MPGGEQGQADGHTDMLDHIRRKLRAAAYTHVGVVPWVPLVPLAPWVPMVVVVVLPASVAVS